MKKMFLKIIANLTPLALVVSTTTILTSCSASVEKVNISELSDKIKSKIKEDFYMFSQDQENKIITEFKNALAEVVYEEKGEIIDVILDVDFYIDYQRIDESKSIKIISLESSNKICGEFEIFLMRGLNEIRLSEIYIEEEELNNEIKIIEQVKNKLINDNDLIDKNDLGYITLKVCQDKKTKERYILIEPNVLKTNHNLYSNGKNMYFSGEKRINMHIKKDISKIKSKLEISEYDIINNENIKDKIATILNNEFMFDKIKSFDIDYEQVDTNLKVTAKNDSKSIYNSVFFDIKKIDELDKEWFKSLILSEKNKNKWNELIQEAIEQNNQGKSEDWFKEIKKDLNINIDDTNKQINLSCYNRFLKGSCIINVYGVYDLNNEDLKEQYNNKISNKENFDGIKKSLIDYIIKDYKNKYLKMPDGYEKEIEKYISITKNGDSINVASNDSLLFNNGFKFQLRNDKVNLQRWNDSLNIPEHWIKDLSKFKNQINEKIVNHLKMYILGLNDSDLDIDIENKKISANPKSEIVIGSFYFGLKTTYQIKIIEDKIPQINSNNLKYLDKYIDNAFKQKTKEKENLIKDTDYEIINEEKQEKITIKSLDKSEKIYGDLTIVFSNVIDISYLEENKDLPIIYEGEDRKHYKEKIINFINSRFSENYLEENTHYIISGGEKAKVNESILVEAISGNSKISGKFSIKNINERIDIEKIESIKNMSIIENNKLKEIKNNVIKNINDYKNENEKFKDIPNVDDNDIEVTKNDDAIVIRGVEGSLKVKGTINVMLKKLIDISLLNFDDDKIIKIKRWFKKDEVIKYIIEYLKVKVNQQITEKDIDVDKIKNSDIEAGIIFLFARSDESKYIKGTKEIHLSELPNLKNYISSSKVKFEGGILSKNIVRGRIISYINIVPELRDSDIKYGEDYKIEFLDNNDDAPQSGIARITILKNEKGQRLYYNKINDKYNVFDVRLTVPDISNLVKDFGFKKDNEYYSGGRAEIPDGFKKHDLAIYNVLKYIISNKDCEDPVVKFVELPKEPSKQAKKIGGYEWHEVFIRWVNDNKKNSLHFDKPRKPPGTNVNSIWRFRSGTVLITIDERHKNKLPFKFSEFWTK